MNCPNCGNPIRLGAPFCGECGVALESASIVAPPPPPPPPPAPPIVDAPASNPFLISVPPGVLTPPRDAAPDLAPPPAMQVAAPQVVVPGPAETDNDIEATRVSARRRARQGWSLEFSDGQRVQVAGSALVGRGPAADDRWPGAKLVAVVDATKTVSKTHAVLETIDDVLWVTDLHSSNGVFIEGPDGDDIDVEPGIRAAAPAGSSILLGDFLVKVDRR